MIDSVCLQECTLWSCHKSSKTGQPINSDQVQDSSTLYESDALAVVYYSCSRRFNNKSPGGNGFACVHVCILIYIGVGRF